MVVLFTHICGICPPRYAGKKIYYQFQTDEYKISDAQIGEFWNTLRLGFFVSCIK
jgi:hypothetical protein